MTSFVDFIALLLGCIMFFPLKFDDEFLSLICFFMSIYLLINILYLINMIKC